MATECKQKCIAVRDETVPLPLSIVPSSEMDNFSPHLIMPTKPRKSTPHSSKPAKKPRDAKAAKKGPSGAKSAPKAVDIFSPAAMENLYYISHNAMDCLTFRGFGWSQTKSRKKKLGSKPKKKK